MLTDKQAALRILGLWEGATDEEVRSAYKKLSMRWHPDKNQNSKESTHMMQQLNAAKDKLGQGGLDVSEDHDEYYDDDDYDDDDYADPFSDGRMDFGAFVRMFARMRAEGIIDDDGYFMGPPPGYRGYSRGDTCFCPKCMQRRKVDDREREMRREAARQRRLQEESAAAELKALEERDKKMQLINPRKSLAWQRGGESKERLIREHFLRQTPSVLLHEAGNSHMVLVLDVPDVSLLEDGHLPPKGVEWEVSYCQAGDKKWKTLMAPKEFDNIVVPLLTPGTEYQIKVRTGAAGNLTWSGSPDWGTWSKPQQYKTTGQVPAAAGSSRKGKAAAGKKKKNRDAAFAKLQQQEAGEEVEQQDDADEQQQQQSGEQQQHGIKILVREEDSWRQQQQQELSEEEQQQQTEQQDDDLLLLAQLQQQQQPLGTSSKRSSRSNIAESSAAAAAVGSEAGSDHVEPAAAAAADANDDVSDNPSADPQDPATADLSHLQDHEQVTDVITDSESDEDPLAAAERAAAAVEAAEAAGLPLAQVKPQKKSKHNPTIMAPCVYYPLGRCKAGNQCKFQHVKPDKSAAAAAAKDQGSTAAAAGSSGVSKDVARLDVVMGGEGKALDLKKSREVVELLKRIVKDKPTPRYQPAPQEDGFYLKPLFMTAYDVADQSYATWFRNVVQGGSSSSGSSSSATTTDRSAQVRSKFMQALGEHPPAAAAAAAGGGGSGGSSAAAGSSGTGSSGSSGAGVVAHNAKHPQLCKWYPMGTCKFGSNCKFVHQKGAAVKPAAAAAVKVLPRPAAAPPAPAVVLDPQTAFAAVQAAGGAAPAAAGSSATSQQSPALSRSSSSGGGGGVGSVAPAAAASPPQRQHHQQLQQQQQQQYFQQHQQHFGRIMFSQQPYKQPPAPFQPQQQQQQYHAPPLPAAMQYGGVMQPVPMTQPYPYFPAMNPYKQV